MVCLCKPIDGSLCTLARNGSGEPCQAPRKCKRCKERRCKSHCRCGRLKEFGKSYRARPRTGSTTGMKKANGKKTSTAQTATLPLSSGSANAPSAKTYAEGTWLDLLVKEPPSAHKALLCSYLYDDDALHAALLKRLKCKDGFESTPALDRSAHYRGMSTTQAKKVKELRTSGAKVYLATGHDGTNGHTGIQHRKGTLLDDDVVWSGSANLSHASRVNRELVYRFENCRAVCDTRRLLKESLADAMLLKVLG